MIGNRIIDNAAVAAASINRRPVVTARAQALAHPTQPGATSSACRPAQRVVAGMGGLGERRRGARTRFPRHVSRRRLFASRRQHPADPGGGAALRHRRARTWCAALATGYEIQVDLVKGICLHEHKIDHIAHLGPSAAAGIGALLGLADRDDLPGGAAGAARHHHHAAVAQGRDLELEGLCAGASPASWRSKRSTA